MLSPHVQPVALALVFVFFVQGGKQDVTSVPAATKEIQVDMAGAAALSQQDEVLTLKERQIKNTRLFFSQRAER